MNTENKETTELEKTFTQDQVNAIVGKRLAEQKQQHEAELMKREQELNKREMSIRAKELLAEKQLPKGLAEVLRYDTEDELVKAIETIENARGFKAAEQPMPERKIMDDNRLPSGVGYEDTADGLIAQAFRLKGLNYGD